MAVPNSNSFNRSGLILHQNLLPPDLIEALRFPIDSKYEEIELARRNGRSIDEIIETTERFTPTASSFTVGAAISEETLRLVLAQIAAAPTGPWIENQLGSDVVCDLDQSWVRRQYAPAQYPQFHAPHAWHQDGALKFDFAAHQARFPKDALLEMVTCWITLDHCGEDAPGLEIVVEKLQVLLLPAELSDASVKTRFAADKFRQPTLGPGDALLFRGNYLHRTHVTSTMTKNRTSVELRFFMKKRTPERIKADRFVELR